MQFQVPQFIDLEPKIVGPLTLKQFLYIAGGALPAFLLFFILKFWLWIIVAAVLGAIGIGLAFVKINGQPLTKILRAAFGYFWQPRFYLWRRMAEEPKMPSLPKIPKTAPAGRAPLKDLLLKISTTKHPIEKREKLSKSLSIFKITRETLQTFRKTTGEREAARRVDYR